MRWNSSPKDYFRFLIVLTLILMIISVFKFNQDFSRSVVTLTSTLRLNGSGINIRSQYFTPPIPLARWRVTSVPLYNGSTVANTNVSMATSNSSENRPLNDSASSLPPSCSPVLNIVYIKTLKTGSTSLQTIINRYGFFHNLSFVLNRHSAGNGHFYHLPFTDKMAETHFLPPIHIAADDYPNYRNYNMIAVHVRYQRDAMKRYFAPGTQYMTIIRDPGMQWESAFNHFQFHDAILLNLPGNSNSSAVDNTTIAPFGNSSFANGSLEFRGCKEKLEKKSMMKEDNSTFNERNCSMPELIEEFMKHPIFYRERLHFMKWENEVGKRWAYSRNNQIYDLGLDPEYHDNITAVKRWIQNLQSELTLVLINEYFDESLLVMRRLFCWSFMDIVYIAKNVRINDVGVSIADELRDKIRKWNSADTLLYAHFNRTLWDLIDDYGPSFESDLKYFKKLLETVLHNCTEETEKSLWDKQHLFGHYERVPRKNATLFCQTVAETKTELHHRIYCRQDINHTAKACQGAKKTLTKRRYYNKVQVNQHRKPTHLKPRNTRAQHPGVASHNHH